MHPVNGGPGAADSKRDICRFSLEKRRVEVSLKVVWRRARGARRSGSHWMKVGMAGQRVEVGMGVTGSV